MRLCGKSSRLPRRHITLRFESGGVSGETVERDSSSRDHLSGSHHRIGKNRGDFILTATGRGMYMEKTRISCMHQVPDILISTVGKDEMFQ